MDGEEDDSACPCACPVTSILHQATLDHMKIAPVMLAITCMLCLTSYAASMWLPGEPVPVDRILPQLEKRVGQRPKEAHGHYLLGRVHGAAFALGSASIHMGDVEELDQRNSETGEGAVGATIWQRNYAEA